jgi:predicted acetyltransferase
MTRTPDGYRTIEVSEARREEVLEVDRLAFALSADPEADAVVPLTLDWTRTVALEGPDGTLAGVHSSYPFTLPVPGAAVPCSGLTWVGVRPDHRRRGLLSSMICTHVERSLARREPVSALFAAEPAIYGRFGYGCAADDLRLTLARGAGLRQIAGSAELELRLERADVALHDDLVHAVHGAAGAGRPGWIERRTKELRARHLADPRSKRDGAEELRVVTVRDRGGVRGYALFRRTEHWTGGGPAGTVRVADLAALDGAATHRLWSFLLDLDLMATVESPMLAVDDALLHLLVNPRGAAPRVTDNLWVRLLDLPVALGARRYAAPVDVVLEVTDALVPANAGRWRVRTGAGPLPVAGYPAEVSATSGAADLSLDVRELGATYLGGRSFGALARAGLVVEHRPGAVLAASAAFGWPTAPLCSWVF